MDKYCFDENILAIVEDIRPMAEKLALDIWKEPELAFLEVFASHRYEKLLCKEGFSVEKGVFGLDTAVLASWGEGGPVVGILGEYDALPGLSQKVQASKEPIKEGAPGHGCGHNLLGAASCAAAVALKRYLKTENIPGQIRFYGCPAEENGAGKAFMAREGAFDDLDAALCWHPWNTSDMWSNGSMAMIKVDFHFTGKALPVPADDIRWPHLACDAFEAATLMDTGLKYLGGHLSPGVRIHSAIELENGDPVSTTKEARLRILLRAPSGSLARECYERIIRCSEGAALMSGASVERCFVFGMLDFMPNMVLTRLLGQAFNKAGPPDFDEEDMRFASRLRSTINPGQLLETDSMFNRGADTDNGFLCRSVPDGIACNRDERTSPGSTDVGDVSHRAPAGQFAACCVPCGVSLHTWQSTASCGSPIGLKGMNAAARVLTLAGSALFKNPAIVNEAKKEFDETGARSESLLPPDAEPAIHISDGRRWR